MSSLHAIDGDDTHYTHDIVVLHATCDSALEVDAQLPGCGEGEAACSQNVSEQQVPSVKFAGLDGTTTVGNDVEAIPELKGFRGPVTFTCSCSEVSGLDFN